jgi:hypothetical protein
MSWAIGWVNCFNPKTKGFGEEGKIGGEVSTSNNDSSALNCLHINQSWV